jgi:hypothetical protein
VSAVKRLGNQLGIAEARGQDGKRVAVDRFQDADAEEFVYRRGNGDLGLPEQPAVEVVAGKAGVHDATSQTRLRFLKFLRPAAEPLAAQSATRKGSPSPAMTYRARKKAAGFLSYSQRWFQRMSGGLSSGRLRVFRLQPGEVDANRQDPALSAERFDRAR